MNGIRIIVCIETLAALCVLGFSAPAHAQNKGGDIQYGRTPDGHLRLVYTGGLVVLAPIENGPLSGWGEQEPGFFAIVDSIPEADVVPLSPGNNIVVQVEGAGFDNGLKAWLPGFGAYLGNGPLSATSWDLGPDNADSHPFWQIDPTTAGFVGPPAQTEWNATFRIIDTGATGYLPSDPITVPFAPEPAGVLMLGLGGMLAMRRRWRGGASAALVMMAVSSARAQHAGDVFVGRSATNQMKVGGFFASPTTIVLPCVNGLFQGWATNNPGFDHVIDPDPANDLYPMDAGAQIRLLCVAIAPAFRAITPSFQIINTPGQITLLGSSTLHIHLTWHINSADPAFNPSQVDWFATFKLVDTGSTGYTDSDSFTFHFTNAACPFGDVNDDGVIDGRDIQAFVTVFLDPGSATDRQRCLADCDRDCTLTSADVSALVNRLLGS